MTKTRMMYFLVLAVGITVLIWDKSSTTSSVSNAKQANARGSQSPPRRQQQIFQTQANTTKSSQNDTGYLSGNKAAWIEHENTYSDNQSQTYMNSTRDLFSPPQAFEIGQDDADEQHDSAIVQLASLNLSSIIVKELHSHAIIDGKKLSVGDYIGQYKITEIKNDRVIFQADNNSISILLDRKQSQNWESTIEERDEITQKNNDFYEETTKERPVTPR